MEFLITHVNNLAKLCISNTKQNSLIWEWSNQTAFANIDLNSIIYTQVVEPHDSWNHQNNSCITTRFVKCNEGIETQYFTLWLYNGVHVHKIIKVYPVIKVTAKPRYCMI